MGEVVAAGIIGAVAFMLAPVRRSFAHVATGAWKYAADVVLLIPRIGEIHHQLHPNGGGSIPDRVKVLEAGQLTLEHRQETTSDQCSISIDQGNALIDGKELAMSRTDAAGNVVWVSKQWCYLAGIQRDEALGNGWIKAVRADFQKEVVGRWREAVQNGTPCSVEFRFITGAYVRATANPIRNGDRIIGWRGEIEEARQTPDYVTG